MIQQDVAEYAQTRHAIDACHSLFLDSIGETKESTLRIVASEAKRQALTPSAEDDSVVAQLAVGARPIETDLTCLSFDFVFESRFLIFYSVLNESYGRYPESPELFEGKLFRVFESSHLLDFLRRTTDASDDWPGPLQHYEIATNNHVVDVIATAPPIITVRDHATLRERQKEASRRLAKLGGSAPGFTLSARRRFR